MLNRLIEFHVGLTLTSTLSARILFAPQRPTVATKYFGKFIKNCAMGNPRVAEGPVAEGAKLDWRREPMGAKVILFDVLGNTLVS